MGGRFLPTPATGTLTGCQCNVCLRVAAIFVPASARAAGSAGTLESGDITRGATLVPHRA